MTTEQRIEKLEKDMAQLLADCSTLHQNYMQVCGEIQAYRAATLTLIIANSSHAFVAGLLKNLAQLEADCVSGSYTEQYLKGVQQAQEDIRAALEQANRMPSNDVGACSPIQEALRNELDVIKTALFHQAGENVMYRGAILSVIITNPCDVLDQALRKEMAREEAHCVHECLSDGHLEGVQEAQKIILQALDEAQKLKNVTAG